MSTEGQTFEKIEKIQVEIQFTESNFDQNLAFKAHLSEASFRLAEDGKSLKIETNSLSTLITILNDLKKNAKEEENELDEYTEDSEESSFVRIQPEDVEDEQNRGDTETQSVVVERTDPHRDRDSHKEASKLNNPSALGIITGDIIFANGSGEPESVTIDQADKQRERLLEEQSENPRLTDSVIPDKNASNTNETNESEPDSSHGTSGSPSAPSDNQMAPKTHQEVDELSRTSEKSDKPAVEPVVNTAADGDEAVDAEPVHEPSKNESDKLRLARESMSAPASSSPNDEENYSTPPSELDSAGEETAVEKAESVLPSVRDGVPQEPDQRGKTSNERGGRAGLIQRESNNDNQLEPDPSRDSTDAPPTEDKSAPAVAKPGAKVTAEEPSRALKEDKRGHKDGSKSKSASASAQLGEHPASTSGKSSRAQKEDKSGQREDTKGESASAGAQLGEQPVSTARKSSREEHDKSDHKKGPKSESASAGAQPGEHPTRKSSTSGAQKEDKSGQREDSNRNKGDTSSTNNAPSSAPSFSFVTPEGIRVNIFIGDLTSLGVDAITNAANGRLAHGGGLAGAIIRIGGRSIQDESYDIVRRRGTIPISQVAVTAAGRLPCKQIIHAVGPDNREIRNETKSEQYLKDTFLNVFKCANSELKIRSLAVPMISTGIFAVPVQACAAAFWQALTLFRQQHYYPSKALKELNVVDMLPASIREMITHCAFQMKFVSDFRVIDPSATGEQEDIEDDAMDVDEDEEDVVMARVQVREEAPPGGSEGAAPQCAECRRQLSATEDFVKRNGLFLCTTCHSHAFASTDPSRRTFNIPRCIACDNPLPPESFFIAIDATRFVCYPCMAAERGMALPDPRTVFPSSTEMPPAGTAPIAGAEFQYDQPLAGQFAGRGQHRQTATHEVSAFERERDRWMDVSGGHPPGHASMAEHRAESGRGGQAPPMDYAMAAGRGRGRWMDVSGGHPPGHVSMAAASSSTKDGRESTKSEHRPSGEKGHDSAAATDDHNNCPICLDPMDKPKDCHALPCKHAMHKDCFKEHKKQKDQRCPICFVAYGTITGTQPKGTMNTKVIEYNLQCFKDAKGAIQITYSIPNGTQGSEHPNPGRPYSGITRIAYLPNNKEGQHVLKLLKRAFEQRLVFTVGQSRTTGLSDVVTWNDIHHKTSLDGGPSNFGYPDPTYLSRVKEELATFGIV